MKALAWDDKPADYMDYLKISLNKYHKIDLEIKTSADEFLTTFGTGDDWDFVILDLKEEIDVQGGEAKNRGLELADIIKHEKPHFPLIFVTNFIEELYRERSFSRPSSYRSKGSSPETLSYEIYQDLKDWGLACDYSKIFVSHGHDRNAEKATEQLKRWLESYGLSPISITAAQMTGILMDEIVETMRGCAAIIAICTPDDCVITQANGQSLEFCQPRQNVIMETGIAIGMNGGIRKLIILQMYDKSSTKADTRAELPSNFGGVITIRFKKKIHETFEDLETRLRKLRAEI